MSANVQGPPPGPMKGSPILAVARRATELRAIGHNFVDLTLGEPDFAPPPNRDAAVAAPGRRLGYTPANGIPALRMAAPASIARNQEVLAERNVIYRRRHDAENAIVRESAKLRVQAPGDAFYFFAPLRNHSNDVAVNHQLIEAGVATVPGSAFGAPVTTDTASPEEVCRRMVHAPGAR